jgi:hypothetical protein
VGKSPIGNQFGPYSPDRASSWSLTRGAQPVGLFGSGRHGFPVARVSKAARHDRGWELHSSSAQHATRNEWYDPAPHTCGVAWLCSPSRDPAVAGDAGLDRTHLPGDRPKRPRRRNRSEPRLRLRYDRACPARATELRPPLSAPQQTRRQTASLRVGILSPAKAGVATKVRLEAQAFRRTTAIESFPARKNQNDIRCILGTWQVVGILVAAQRSIAHSRFGSATQMTTA